MIVPMKAPPEGPPARDSVAIAADAEIPSRWLAPLRPPQRISSMIPKSGYRFSEKIMLQKKIEEGLA
jgi:hypothetical protein